MSLKKLYPYFINNRFYNTRDVVHKTGGWFSFAKYTCQVIKNYIFGRFLPEQWYHIPYVSDFIHRGAGCSVTPMGHSTVLISTAYATIITDPVFWDVGFLIRRNIPLLPDPNLLPPIDIILLSHNHRDHCDIESLKLIVKKNPFVKAFVPLGMRSLVESTGINNVQEYTWWQSEEEIYDEKHKINFTCLPALHWSGRGFFDHNKSLWASWMIEVENKKIYFAGDTGYGNHFKVIHEQVGKIDFVLLPIGPVEPQDWMKSVHIDACDAVQAFVDLDSPYVIPIHWGVLCLGMEAPDAEIQNFVYMMKQLNQEDKICGLQIGKTVHIVPNELPEQVFPEKQTFFEKNSNFD